MGTSAWLLTVAVTDPWGLVAQVNLERISSCAARVVLCSVALCCHVDFFDARSGILPWHSQDMQYVVACRKYHSNVCDLLQQYVMSILVVQDVVS